MLYKQHKLKNGLNLVFVPNKKIKLIYIHIGIKIGSDTETVKTLELSHFIEHLFTLLTSNKYNSGLENRNMLSKYNIEQDAEVITKNTYFQYIMKKKYLKKFLDMLVHALVDFTIDEQLFKNEKNSVIEELNAIISDADYKFETFVDKMLYKTHTRNYSQEMRLSNVKKTKSKDILEFFKKFYTPENFVISFFGDVNEKETVKLFTDHYKLYNMLNIKPNKLLYNHEHRINIRDPKRVFYLKENKQTCNLKIMFNIPFLFFDDEYYCVFAILNILTFDLSSILLNRLRNQEGLIYDINGQMDLDENTNKLSFVFFETNVETDKIYRVIEIILEELNNLKQGKISDLIIKRYKEHLKIKHIRDSLTFQPMKLIDEYTKYVLWDKKIVKFDDEYRNFGNVNKKYITKISNKIFDFNKISIFYNGSKNHDSKINKLFNNY